MIEKHDVQIPRRRRRRGRPIAGRFQRVRRREVREGDMTHAEENKSTVANISQHSGGDLANYGNDCSA